MWNTKSSLYIYHRGISTVIAVYSRLQLDILILIRKFGLSGFVKKNTHTYRGFVCVCVCVCVVKADSDTYELTSPIPRKPNDPVVDIPVKAVP